MCRYSIRRCDAAAATQQLLVARGGAGWRSTLAARNIGFESKFGVSALSTPGLSPQIFVPWRFLIPIGRSRTPTRSYPFIGLFPKLGEAAIGGAIRRIGNFGLTMAAQPSCAD